MNDSGPAGRWPRVLAGLAAVGTRSELDSGRAHESVDGRTSQDGAGGWATSVDAGGWTTSVATDGRATTVAADGRTTAVATDGRAISVAADGRATADGAGGRGITGDADGTTKSTGLLAGRSTAKVAAVAAAAVVVVAAAAGAIFLYQQDRGPVDLSGVPEDVDTVTYADVDEMQDDPAVRRVVDSVLSAGDAPATPEDYEELQASFRRETGLSLDGLHSVVAFSKRPADGEGNETEYTGTLLRTDWSGEEVAAAYAETAPGDPEYVADSYAGSTVYKPGGDGGSGVPPTWVGVLDDGRLVTGTPDAVRDAIDVDAGDAAAFGGDLKAAFRSARDGYVKTATRVPGSRVPDEEVSLGGGELETGPFQDLEMVAGAYYVDGNTVGVEVAMYATGESAADDVRDLLVGAVSLASATVEAEDVESALRDVEIERDGARVDARFENEVDQVAAVIEALGEQFGGENASLTSVAPVVPAPDSTAGTVLPGAPASVSALPFAAATGTGTEGPAARSAHQA